MIDLARIGACNDAQQWAAGLTPRHAWNTCERADWLAWLVVLR